MSEIEALERLVSLVGTPGLYLLLAWSLYLEPRLRKSRAGNGRGAAALPEPPPCHGHAERIARLEERVRSEAKATTERFAALTETINRNHEDVCRRIERLADQQKG